MSAVAAGFDWCTHRRAVCRDFALSREPGQGAVEMAIGARWKPGCDGRAPNGGGNAYRAQASGMDCSGFVRLAVTDRTHDG
ncbi:hypothetical protein AQ611_17860 [Burkholderia singularis]|nr:hypothetical protein AQ611_17860 [Burkholderia sp. Bp7605]